MTEPARDGFEANNESQTSVEFQKLCDHIRSCAAMTELEEKWGFVVGHDDLLRIDMSPADFVAALEPDHSADELVAIGLCERVGEELRLSSWIDEDIDLYVTIDESTETIRFSARNEFLFPVKRTALDLALERNAPDATQAPHTLFVIESPEAAKVMHRLGLKSVVSDGLEELDGHDVRRLFNGDRQSDFGWRYFVLLVNFDVTGLENRPAATIEQVINRLADAADAFAIDVSRRFGVCRPTASEFRDLERAVAFKDADLVRQALENWSTAARSVAVGNWRSHLASETLSFAAASRALTDALQLPNGFARQLAMRVALPAYRAAGKEAVMQKFFDAIDRERDPFDRLNLMAAAAFAENFFENDPLVRSADAILAGKIPASARELRDESFNERLRCTAELRRIQRDRHGKRHGL